MGLDLYLYAPAAGEATHVGRSYGGFSHFRQRLCADAGLGPINNYVGFGGTTQWPSGTPLVSLLNHSDCEGELWGWECEGLPDAIRAVVRLWPEGEWDREYGELLASMIERAVREDGLVVFR